MLRIVLLICVFLFIISVPVNADNYSFTVDKIAVNATANVLRIDGQAYTQPFCLIQVGNYGFKPHKNLKSLSVYCKDDEVIIDNLDKQPTYKGFKKVTVGSKTNVYVSHVTDSDIGNSWIYKFYFKGHEVWCISSTAQCPKIFSNIINTVRSAK